MKVDIFYDYPFDSCLAAVEFFLQILQTELASYPRVRFSQVTAFFSQPEEEHGFLSHLVERHPRPFVVLQEIEEPPYCGQSKRILLSHENVEQVLDYLSHLPERPLTEGEWDGLIVFRRPSTAAVALLVSAYVRNRNLPLLTTIADGNDGVRLIVSWGTL